ncbi:beta-N-acetylhexosaminidase [Nocardia sp. NPDC058499]|uniref:beta-N-acetylhexosaminidase n=1 Tax=Nocardia sp. NPDC058499 TaxID=3346530 RepID=UPI00366870D2
MSLPLIPAPAHHAPQEGTFQVRTGTPVVAEPTEIVAVARQFIEDARADTGIELEATPPSPAPAIVVEFGDTTLDSVAPATGARADRLSAGDLVDERYGITITPHGVRIWATTTEGVHRGLTSLRQLIATHARDGLASLPALTILDGPRFAWRGLSVDVVRTFHGPDTVRRVIDMCSLHKVNVLHLHLTDDQGWRVEVPSRPELTGIGAAGAVDDRPGGFYTRAELSELVAYAAARFVTIVPEIDMPGHTGAIFRSYPELAPAHPVTSEHSGGLAIGTLDHERPETWRFVEDVLDAVIPQFPQSAYLHIGGDEAFGMADEAHAAFVERVTELVRARGRRVLGWQEIARAALSSDETVQYWMDTRDIDSMANNDTLKSMVPPEYMPLITEALAHAEHDVPRALAMGATLLISPTSRLYFDRPHAHASLAGEQEDMRARVGLRVYPALSLRDGVEWDPITDTPGISEESSVAGVEAAIWCETITNRDELEFMLLPRLSGLAEKAWATAGPTEWAPYAERLAAQSAIWDARGWNWFASDEVPWQRTPTPNPTTEKAQ